MDSKIQVQKDITKRVQGLQPSTGKLGLQKDSFLCVWEKVFGHTRLPISFLSDSYG